MSKIQVVRYIAETLTRIDNLNKHGSATGINPATVETSLIAWVRKHGPSGSGVDMGTKLIPCSPEAIKLSCSFHHMDENGYYCGWTDHVVTARPSFVFGMTLTLSGPNKNDIKDYLHGLYYDWLSSEIEHPGLVERI